VWQPKALQVSEQECLSAFCSWLAVYSPARSVKLSISPDRWERNLAVIKRITQVSEKKTVLTREPMSGLPRCAREDRSRSLWRWFSWL